MIRLSLLVFAVLSSACAPRLFVNVLRPAPVNFGSAKKLTIIESQGRPSAREELMKELGDQVKNSGYFALTDRTAEGITVTISGQAVQASVPPGADEVALRIDVKDWNADKEVTDTGRKDKDGKPVVNEKWKSRVALVVTAFNSAGKTFIVEKEYSAAGEDPKDEDAAIMSAAREVITRLLEDVTPTYVQRAIQFDDSEEAQRPIINLARNGGVPKAIEAEKALLAKSPNSAAAIFNLAVLTDSQGLYREALPLYDQAIKLQNKELYGEVRAECQQRLNDAEALAN